MTRRYSYGYHHALELPLLGRHDSELHLVGKIDGLLAALAELNRFVNHSPSFGFVEIDAGAGLVQALDAAFGDPGSVELIPIPVADWPVAVAEELTRVCLDEGANKAWPKTLREPLGRMFQEVVVLLGLLLVRDEPLHAYSVRWTSRARAKIGPVGYISDGTMAFTVGDRAYLLGLGWSD